MTAVLSLLAMLFTPLCETMPVAKYGLPRGAPPQGAVRGATNRIGVRPWPKLFQNLRSTRETEPAEDYPLHLVCAWIGNGQAVAKKHYLQVTDEHFEWAAADPARTVCAQQARARPRKS